MIRTTCRSCGGDFEDILDLGLIVPSTFLRPEDPDPPALPLDLVRCLACGLVQLRHTANPEDLYRQYWYVSSTNESMIAELKQLVRSVIELVGGVSIQDVVLDIGANDGCLLSFYESNPSPPVRMAYEPARNLYDRLRQHVQVVFPDFFPTPGVIPPKHVKIATSIACFYDVEDPRSFVAEIDRILTDDGVWIVQFQDLKQMLEKTAYDNVCHEHLCYYSLKTFMDLLSDRDLGVVRVERRAINGGSLRIYVRRRTFEADASVSQLLQAESDLDLFALEQFCWRVDQQRQQLQGLLAQVVRQYGPLDMYGASTKASTLLQFCGIGPTTIRQAVERTPEKVGLVTGATRIPIVAESTWRQDPAPYALAVIWQFRDQLLRREAAYLFNGGQFIFPLPAVEVVRGIQIPATLSEL